MKKKSLKTRLLFLLERYGGELDGGYLEKRAVELGYKGSYASRQLRLLVEDDKLDVTYQGNKKHVVYKAKKHRPTIKGYMDYEKGIYVITNRK